MASDAKISLAQQKVDTVEVSISIFSISEIDELKQSFQVDMSYVVLWNDPAAPDVVSTTVAYPTQSPHHLDIRNSYKCDQAFPPYLTQWPRSENKTHNFRWMARETHTLSCPIVLRDFPFDVQDLQIVCRLPRSHDHRTHLKPIGVKYVGVLQAEWTLYEVNPVEQYEGRCNQLLFRLPAQRSPFYFLVNICGIMMLLTTICAYVAVLPAQAPSERAQITTTLLLTSVAFKFLVASQLPKVTYLTQLDIYFFFAFLCQGLVILENALISMLDDIELAEKIDKYFFIVGTCVWFGYHAVVGALMRRKYLYYQRKFGKPAVTPEDGYYREIPHDSHGDQIQEVH